jgi:hypothetical protein
MLESSSTTASGGCLSQTSQCAEDEKWNFLFHLRQRIGITKEKKSQFLSLSASLGCDEKSFPSAN